VFFAFSGFVMAALARLPYRQGIKAADTASSEPAALSS
jgi:uncharacterized membrane protein